MDALDRTFRHLLQTIQARYPAYLTQPFEVAELYQNILPYRHHRRELGLETNQDYELVLLQLLSGARDYFVVNDEMRARLARELASPNPDPGAFREFSTSPIALSPAAVRRFQSGAPETEPALVGAARSSAMDITQPVAAPRASSTATVPSPITAQPAARRAPGSNAGSSSVSTGPRAASASGSARAVQTIVPQSGEQCRYCSGALPAGRRITFCPHCGQNLTVINCMACGTELELGWKFCTTCGRQASTT
jgi:Double zinc ribbon